METVNVSGITVTPIVVPDHGPRIMVDGKSMSPEQARILSNQLRIAACQAECAAKSKGAVAA